MSIEESGEVVAVRPKALTSVRVTRRRTASVEIDFGWRERPGPSHRGTMAAGPASTSPNLAARTDASTGPERLPA